MKKSKTKKTRPKLEYLQDPDKVKDPEILRPLYDVDEKLRKSLQPTNLKKEAKDFKRHIKKSFRKK